MSPKEVKKIVTSAILLNALRKNNQAIWSHIWQSSVKQDFNLGMKAAAGSAIEAGSVLGEVEAIAAGLDKAAIVDKLSASDLAAKYFDEHGMEFVKSLTDTDIERLKPILADNLNMHEDAFAEEYADSVSSPDRLKVIKRTESHRARQEGQSEFARQAGAKWKMRLTAHDDRVREDHQSDEDAGWISFDEPYPDTGEMYPGETSINCRCSQEISFADNNPDEE